MVKARDLRNRIRDTRVPMLRFNGSCRCSRGTSFQLEGLWDRLRADRTRFVLGQYTHKAPTPTFVPRGSVSGRPVGPASLLHS